MFQFPELGLAGTIHHKRLAQSQSGVKSQGRRGNYLFRVAESRGCPHRSFDLGLGAITDLTIRAQRTGELSRRKGNRSHPVFSDNGEPPRKCDLTAEELQQYRRDVLRTSRRNSQEDYARGYSLLDENQSSEMLVKGNDDLTVLLGEGEYFLIGHALQYICPGHDSEP